MNTTGTTRIEFHSSIDDALGPRERRFFGEGYRRARHRIHAVRLAGGEGGDLTARAQVAYPADWSRKGEMDQPPHLSTIDVLVLGAETAELCLAHTLGLDDEARARARLVDVRIKAGTRPVEQELADFPVSARIIEIRPDGADRANVLTTVESTVGTLRIRCRIRHESAAVDTSAGSYASPDQLLGDPRLRLYGEGFKGRGLLVEDVEVDHAVSGARALVRMVADPRAVPSRGLDALHAAAASPIDCFVVGLQLGQLLLYGLDRVPRARSNTLWMRETVLELDPDRAPAARSGVADTRLELSRLLRDGKGRTWRSADIVAGLGGIRLRCSVAHSLPLG